MTPISEEEAWEIGCGGLIIGALIGTMMWATVVVIVWGIVSYVKG